MIRAEELREHVMEKLDVLVEQQLSRIEKQLVMAAEEGKSSVRFAYGDFGMSDGVRQLVREALSDHGYAVQYYLGDQRDNTPGHWTVGW